MIRREFLQIVAAIACVPLGPPPNPIIHLKYVVPSVFVISSSEVMEQFVHELYYAYDEEQRKQPLPERVRELGRRVAARRYMKFRYVNNNAFIYGPFMRACGHFRVI